MSIHVYTSLFDVVILFVDGIVLSFLNCLNKIKKKKKENKQYILCYANIWNIAFFYSIRFFKLIIYGSKQNNYITLRSIFQKVKFYTRIVFLYVKSALIQREERRYVDMMYIFAVWNRVTIICMHIWCVRCVHVIYIVCQCNNIRVCLWFITI